MGTRQLEIIVNRRWSWRKLWSTLGTRRGMLSFWRGGFNHLTLKRNYAAIKTDESSKDAENNETVIDVLHDVNKYKDWWLEDVESILAERVIRSENDYKAIRPAKDYMDSENQVKRYLGLLVITKFSCLIPLLAKEEKSEVVRTAFLSAEITGSIKNILENESSKLFLNKIALYLFNVCYDWLFSENDK